MSKLPWTWASLIFDYLGASLAGDAQGLGCPLPGVQHIAPALHWVLAPVGGCKVISPHGDDPHHKPQGRIAPWEGNGDSEWGSPPSAACNKFLVCLAQCLPGSQQHPPASQRASPPLPTDASTLSRGARSSCWVRKCFKNITFRGVLPSARS